jgi:hypothetical protein
MQAVLRLNTFRTDSLPEAVEALSELEQQHTDKEGYVGTLTVDLGQGRFFVANVWDNEEHRLAGLRALGPVVDQLINPLLSGPSELIGVGAVLPSNLRDWGM